MLKDSRYRFLPLAGSSGRRIDFFKMHSAVEYEDGSSFTLTLGKDGFLSYLGPLSLLLQPGCRSRKRLYRREGRGDWGVDGLGGRSSVVSPQRSFY